MPGMAAWGNVNEETVQKLSKAEQEIKNLEIAKAKRNNFLIKAYQHMNSQVFKQ